jgi:hypothetical protein
METARKLEAEWRHVLRGNASTGVKENESIAWHVSLVDFTVTASLYCCMSLLQPVWAAVCLCYSQFGLLYVFVTASLYCCMSLLQPVCTAVCLCYSQFVLLYVSATASSLSLSLMNHMFI